MATGGGRSGGSTATSAARSPLAGVPTSGRSAHGVRISGAHVGDTTGRGPSGHERGVYQRSAASSNRAGQTRPPAERAGPCPAVGCRAPWPGSSALPRRRLASRQRVASARRHSIVRRHRRHPVQERVRPRRSRRGVHAVPRASPNAGMAAASSLARLPAPSARNGVELASPKPSGSSPPASASRGGPALGLAARRDVRPARPSRPGSGGR